MTNETEIPDTTKRAGRPLKSPESVLASLRLKAGFKTRRALSIASGVPMRSLGLYESGKGHPYAANREKLAKALNVSPEALG